MPLVLPSRAAVGGTVMPVLSGDPMLLRRGVWGGWGTHGWGDASRSCPSVRAILPAAQPTHGVPSSPHPPVSPQQHPHVLTPTVPCHQGSLSVPMGPPWPHCQGCHLTPGSSRLCIVLVMLVFLMPPLSHPILPSSSHQPAHGPHIPFPIIARGLLPLCPL